jgi:hypothetical protein
VLVLYLDDCADDNYLVERLQNAGDVVHTPRSEGIRGAEDQVHFEHARNRGWILISKNPNDFRRLHDACLAQDCSHPGLLPVYQYSERRKNMSVDEIVAAIHRLEMSGISLANEIHVLNHWR